MYEFLRDLISKDWVAVLAVLGLWTILYFLLDVLFKLKEIVWIRFEYIWIVIGFIAVLTIIDENNRSFSEYELSNVNLRIENDYDNLLSLSNMQTNCLQFQYNPSIYSKSEFEIIQSKQDAICKWTKDIFIISDSCFKNGKSAILNFPKIDILSSDMHFPCDRINDLIQSINKNVLRRDALNITVKDDSWKEFKAGFGVILLIFAFALRLTIITHKVVKEKRLLKSN
jgi:hypothetical protein